MRRLLFILLFIPLITFGQTNYFVSPYTGNDSDAGTDTTSAWATWQHAFETADAGDTVFFRGGNWFPTTTLIAPDNAKVCYIAPNSIPKYGNSGTIDAHIVYINYPGETPVLDCKNVVASGNFLFGLAVYRAHYIDIIGLTVRNVYQRVEFVQCYGIAFQRGSNVRIERNSVYHVSGRGLFLEGDWKEDSVFAEYIPIPYDTSYIINNDVFGCADTLSPTEGDAPGNAADGLKFYNSVSDSGMVLIVEGNRAWDVSDDGFDIGSNVNLVMKNNWSFNNGYLEAGDGTGFKIGSINDDNTYYTNDQLLRVIENNISVGNTSGFFALEYDGYQRVLAHYNNNFSYLDNTAGFWFSNSNTTYTTVLAQYRNNIAFMPGVNQFSNVYLPYYESHNSWDHVSGYPGWEATDSVTITTEDFISLDTTQLRLPRKADGSLPDITFSRFVAGSDLIGAGVYIGMSATPDIGVDWAFLDADLPETDLPTVVTNSATYIKSVQVTLGGYVLDDGGATVSARGVCWSTTANPTVSDSKIYSGTGTGGYSFTLTELKSNTTYHVRSFAVNVNGTVYGADETFTTNGGTQLGSGFRINGKTLIIR